MCMYISAGNRDDSVGGGRPRMVHMVPEVAQAPQRIRRRSRWLTGDIPVTYRGRTGHLRTHLRASSYGNASSRRRVRFFSVAVIMRGRSSGTPVDLHMFPQARRVGVGLVATCHPAVVGLV